MVALDQRESLRTMLELARGGDPGLADVAAFKVQASRALSPHASAVLLDRETGLPGVIDAGALASTAALLVAADRICQPRGAPVATTGLDHAVFSDTRLVVQAAAWKLLVIWHPDRGRARRARLVRAFLDACRASGRPSVLEGIVRHRPTCLLPPGITRRRYWRLPASSAATARTSTRPRCRPTARPIRRRS